MELRLYYFDFTNWKKFQDVRLASCEILLIFLTEHRLFCNGTSHLQRLQKILKNNN